MKYLATAFALLLCLACAGPVQAEPPALRILFVGNSFGQIIPCPT